MAAFARHETFHFREGWLRKGLLALKKDPQVFARPDATEILGIGKNMVTSLRYWMQATGLAAPANGKGLAVTPLAKLVLKYDRYLEDEGTFWAIHMELAGSFKSATAWYFLFNHYPFIGFDEESYLTHLSRFLFQRGEKAPTTASLKKDFRCMMRTYLPSQSRLAGRTTEDSLDCPLTVLGLMSYLPNTKTYRFLTPSPRRLPAPMVAYSIYRFAAMQKKPVLRLEQCVSEQQSPGRLLRLDTDTLFDYLERIESEFSGKVLRVSRTAGLSTVSIHQRYQPLDILDRYYKHRNRDN